MKINVEKELAALRKMTVGELRAKYADVWNETTNSRHKQWLVKRIIWRMQAMEYGDLSERARQRAAELANDADLRIRPPAETKAKTFKLAAATASRLPPPGSTITRVYKGETLEVLVKDDGFEFEGESYKTLSAVAKKITNSHCNGYLFFRLNKEAC